MKYINLKQDIILLLIIQLINRIFSQKNYTFNMEGQAINSNLEILTLNIDQFNCPMIPSFFFPIALVKSGHSSKGLIHITNGIAIYNKLLDKTIEGTLYQELENMKLFVSIESSNLKECYFGLSLSNSEDLDDLYINLNELKNNDIIEHKIFSFDKWEQITNDNITIKSYFYLGFNHEDFIFKNGSIIGSCDILINDSYWGCYFNELSLNNKTILLKNGTEYSYKIYFVSETYNIQFPYNLLGEIINSTDNICSTKYNDKGTEYLICDENFFKEKKYFDITLKTSEMNITIQVDGSTRYINNIKENEDEKISTKLLFPEDDNWKDTIILPLIMFKNFHVQFNEEKGKVYFYTTDPDILQVKEKESKKESDSSSGSSGLTIFLVILIIIIAIALGFGIFYFIKKRKNTENDINKFNKFEDEEDFKAMDEKRVF